jgi:hypothetical protein
MSTYACSHCGLNVSKSIKPAEHLRQCFGLMELKLSSGQVVKLVEGYTAKGERGFKCQCSLNNGNCTEVYTLKHNITKHMKLRDTYWMGEFKV